MQLGYSRIWYEEQLVKLTLLIQTDNLNRMNDYSFAVWWRQTLISEEGEMIHRLPSVFLSCCGQAADKGQPSITLSHLWVSVPGSVTLLISTMLAQLQWAGAHLLASVLGCSLCRPSAAWHTEEAWKTNTHPHPPLLQQNMIMNYYLFQFVSDGNGPFCIQVLYDISAEAEGWPQVVWFERAKNIHVSLHLYLRTW